MRTFVAVDLAPAIREQLAAVAQDLGRLRLDGRPTRIEGIHLTLKFLGEIEESQIEGIRAALDRSRQDLPGFSVNVEGVGVFPHLARPRVVWFGVGASEPLGELQGRVERELEALGFPPEKREFRPHLTMMRLKSTRRLEDLARYLKDHASKRLGPMEVSEFHLYQSLLRPQGAEYRKLWTFALQGGR